MNKREISTYYLIGVAVIVLALLKLFFEYWYIVIGFIVVGFIYLVLSADKNVEVPAPAENHFGDYELFDLHDERAKRLLDIFFESYADVNTSKNLETVDSRYGVMIDAAEELKAMEVDFDEFWRVYSSLNAEILFNNAVERFLNKQLQEILKLKTAAGRNRRVAKIEDLISRLNNMPQNSKEFAIFKLHRGLNQ